MYKIKFQNGTEKEFNNLIGVDLSRAYLSRADLSHADLSLANLSRANLSGADLSRANLSRSDLIGANLSGANLIGADLSRATLSRANLSGAYLSRANLSGAYLSGVDLIGAHYSYRNIMGMWCKALSDELILELMLWDAESCGIETLNVWAAGEVDTDCPFNNSERDFYFKESRKVWNGRSTDEKKYKTLKTLFEAIAKEMNIKVDNVA